MPVQPTCALIGAQRGNGARRPRVIGHRGSSGTHPENTLLSFEAAVREGADVLEMDVLLTSDGEVVVIHDRTAARTTDGAGDVSRLSLSELRKLDAGYRFSPDGGRTFPFRGRGIKIPSFREVLEAFPNTPLNVEIKSDDPLLAERFLELLDEYGRFDDVTILPMISSKKNRLARSIREREPRAVTGHSYAEIARFVVLSGLCLPRLFRPRGPAIQVPPRKKGLRIVTPAFIRAAHRCGMEVHVWTINDESEMRRFLSMGADALFTDFPGRLRRLVDSADWRIKPPT